MTNRIGTLFRALAGATLVLVMVSGFVPGLLDRDAGLGTHVETPHSPADCPGAHDHTVCVQLNPGLPLPTRAHAQTPTAPSRRLAQTEPRGATGQGSAPLSHRPRGPPA